MATIHNFEELQIWQNARSLAKDIYQITNCEPFVKDYRFCAQIRAAAGSIMDNIAEGFERDGRKEFIQFLYIAKGSCGEVRSQLARALDANYIDENSYNYHKEICIAEASAIANFIQYLKKSDLGGLKRK